MFLDFYQHLPEYINPIAFSIGFFSVRWYSIMWLVGITVIYFLLKSQTKCHSALDAESTREIGRSVDSRLRGNDKKISEYDQLQVTNYQLLNLLFYIIIGILIGGRLGYILFYDLTYFIQNPLKIFLPLNIKACYTLHTTCYTGFYGMSYHGGLIGAILAGIIFANPCLAGRQASPRKLGTPFIKGKDKPYNFWKLADWIILAVPAGYFFGRIGNFLNGELYGRATDTPWGMYFNGQLRHPSQLYEAFFEGIVLLILLWILSNLLKNKWHQYYFPGILFLTYLFSYGFLRFILEFFREPDEQLGFIFNYLTMGQILSIGMIMSGIIILAVDNFYWQKKRKVV